MISNWLNRWQKKNFGKTDEIEEELNKVKEKFDAQFISFIGVSGNINGLNLIFVAEENFDARLFAGIFAELYQKIELVNKEFFNEEIGLSYINFLEKSLFFGPITETVVFAGVLSNEKSVKNISDWLEKNRTRIKPIFNF